jgi:hypothetical protein
MDRFGVLLAIAAGFCRGAAQQEKFFSGEVLGVDLLTGYTVCRLIAARYPMSLRASLKQSCQAHPIE